MKKVLDLTNCNSVEQMCDAIEKDIERRDAGMDTIKSISIQLIAELEDEAAEEPAKKGVFKRAIHWLKGLFSKKK